MYVYYSARLSQSLLRGSTFFKPIRYVRSFMMSQLHGHCADIIIMMSCICVHLSITAILDILPTHRLVVLYYICTQPFLSFSPAPFTTVLFRMLCQHGVHGSCHVSSSLGLAIVRINPCSFGVQLVRRGNIITWYILPKRFAIAITIIISCM